MNVMMAAFPSSMHQTAKATGISADLSLIFITMLKSHFLFLSLENYLLCFICFRSDPCEQHNT